MTERMLLPKKSTGPGGLDDHGLQPSGSARRQWQRSGRQQAQEPRALEIGNFRRVAGGLLVRSRSAPGSTGCPFLVRSHAMICDIEDTIAAIASPAGGAARGIIRLSGPRAIDVVAAAWDAESGKPPQRPPRASVVRAHLRGEGIGAPVPCELYIWPSAHSYTRQPSVEIHTIGSPPLLQALLRSVCRHGARLATPGEFTLRAFLSGRLDLVQAEAVLGVIDARGRRGLENALAQLAGGLGQSLSDLRSMLLDLLAHLEAGLDFVEEDIEFIGREQLLAELAQASAAVAELTEQTMARTRAGETVRAPRRPSERRQKQFVQRPAGAQRGDRLFHGRHHA